MGWALRLPSPLGRLTQLEECFPYKEDVGGSSPSPAIGESAEALGDGFVAELAKGTP